MCPACFGTAATLVAAATTFGGVTGYLLTSWHQAASRHAESHPEGESNGSTQNRVPK